MADQSKKRMDAIKETLIKADVKFVTAARLEAESFTNKKAMAPPPHIKSGFEGK